MGEREGGLGGDGGGGVGGRMGEGVFGSGVGGGGEGGGLGGVIGGGLGGLGGEGLGGAAGGLRSSVVQRQYAMTLLRSARVSGAVPFTCPFTESYVGTYDSSERNW